MCKHTRARARLKQTLEILHSAALLEQHSVANSKSDIIAICLWLIYELNTYSIFILNTVYIMATPLQSNDFPLCPHFPLQLYKYAAFTCKNEQFQLCIYLMWSYCGFIIWVQWSVWKPFRFLSEMNKQNQQGFLDKSWVKGEIDIFHVFIFCFLWRSPRCIIIIITFKPYIAVRVCHTSDQASQLFLSNQVAIHQILWCVGCCFSLVVLQVGTQCDFKHLFFFHQWEVLLPQIDTRFSSSGFCS